MNKSFSFLSILIGLAVIMPPSQLSNQMGDLNFDELCDGLLFNAIPHPSDRNLFIGCVQGRGTLFGCDKADLVFDPYSVKCVDDDPLITTTPEELSTTSSTMGITTTTSRTGGGGNIDIRFVCPPSGNGNIPHRTECDKYYECVRFMQNPKTCDDGFLFDVVTKQCQPEDSALCANIIQCS